MKETNKIRKKKKKKMTFYKGLLIAFCAGLAVIAVLLCMLYASLEKYEEKVAASRVPDVVTIPSLALGEGDNSVGGSADTSVSEDTVSAGDAQVSSNEIPSTEVQTPADNETPSLPITDDVTPGKST